MDRNVQIVGVGGRTSIGLTMPATAAAVRGSINCFSSCDYLRDALQGSPIQMAKLDALAEETFACERMKLLGLAAANEALGPWLERQAVSRSRQRIPVLLSLPAPRPGFSLEMGAGLARELIDELPVTADKERSARLHTGHEGGLAALIFAAQLVNGGHSPVCLVGGLESYKEIDTLHWIESWGRLKRDYQPNGLIPGEGAGFLLICSREFARASGLTPLAEVVGLGRAEEPKPWYSGEATIGKGLTDALQQAFPSQNGAHLRALTTYCDMNGESWRADEWGYAHLRTAHRYGSPLDIRHPADCWGDVGSASGTLLAGLACLDLLKWDKREGAILVWTASGMLPGRSACLLANSPTNNRI